MEHLFRDADEIFSKRMPSRLEAREEVIAQVLEELTARGCLLDPYFDRLSLDELISNAILHGNQADPAKMVAVRAFCSRDCWGVEVSDEGAGFDWECYLRNLKKERDLTRPSGRGLELVMASGAELHFLDGGRRVLMVRRRKR